MTQEPITTTAPVAKPVVAVLGCGVLGRGLIGSLRRSGHMLRLFNRTPARAFAVATEADVVAGTPAEAARGADVVLAAVTDDDAARAVWCDRDGALTGAAAGTLVIESSTLSPDWAQQWSCLADRAGLRPLAVPVTGGRSRAETGTLILFPGGDPAHVQAAESVLAAIGSHRVVFPSVRAASAYKLVHNAFAANALVGLVEALHLADRAGLNPATVVSVLSRWGWAAPVASSCGPRLLDGDFTEVNCSLQNLAKDCGYALRLAEAAGLQLPLSQASYQYFQDALRDGYGAADMSAVGAAWGGGQ